MKAISNFLFETGMLIRTNRSGLKFLGSGNESIAEHIFRVTMIGYVFSKMDPQIDANKLIKMCLFHDLPESRTGDLNYVNKKYVKADEGRALSDMVAGCPFGDEIQQVHAEFNEKKSVEALYANDADQIELLLLLKEELDLGNQYTKDWIKFAVLRVKTETGKQLADMILNTDSTDWWFNDKGDYWIEGK